MRFYKAKFKKIGKKKITIKTVIIIMVLYSIITFLMSIYCYDNYLMRILIILTYYLTPPLSFIYAVNRIKYKKALHRLSKLKVWKTYANTILSILTPFTSFSTLIILILQDEAGSDRSALYFKMYIIIFVIVSAHSVLKMISIYCDVMINKYHDMTTRSLRIRASHKQKP